MSKPIKDMIYARDLQKKFPKETRGLSLLEIEAIWSEYSDSMAAGWLIPDKESVERIFKLFTEEER